MIWVSHAMGKLLTLSRRNFPEAACWYSNLHLIRRYYDTIEFYPMRILRGDMYPTIREPGFGGLVCLDRTAFALSKQKQTTEGQNRRRANEDLIKHLLIVSSNLHLLDPRCFSTNLKYITK